MLFSKEKLLLEITSKGDFSTIQYIAQNNFLISLLSLFLITLIILIIYGFKVNKKDYWMAITVAMLINLFLTILIIVGLLPSVTSLK